MKCSDSVSFKYLYGERNVISYGRFSEIRGAAVIINNHDFGTEVTVPVWEIGACDGSSFQVMIQSGRRGYVCPDHAEKVQVKDGRITVTMPAESAVILLQYRLFIFFYKFYKFIGFLSLSQHKIVKFGYLFVFMYGDDVGRSAWRMSGIR